MRQHGKQEEGVEEFSRDYMYSKKYSVFLYNNGSSRFMKLFSRPFVLLTQDAKNDETVE